MSRGFPDPEDVLTELQEALASAWMRVARIGERLWLVVGALLLVTLGGFLVVDIQPGQSALRINNLTGAQTAITELGWTIRIPYVHAVHLLDVAPHTFSMKDKPSPSADSPPLDPSPEPDDLLSGRRLTVRASDGSNFHFEDTTVIFQLSPARVVAAVRDSGPDDGFMRWLKPYVRAILRDEFGRESTIDVSDPTTYEVATQRAKARLNEVLEPHGVVVSELVTPRPKFNEAYERAIEERNALGNQEMVILSDLDRAGTERERRLAEVDQLQNNQIQERRAALEKDLATAVADQAQSKREADTRHIAKISEGQAALSGAERRAEQLAGELAAKYEGRKAEVSAFRSQPVERVMEKLATRLKGVTIEIQPYADDAAPRRVVYEETHRNER